MLRAVERKLNSSEGAEANSPGREPGGSIKQKDLAAKPAAEIAAALKSSVAPTGLRMFFWSDPLAYALGYILPSALRTHGCLRLH